MIRKKKKNENLFGIAIIVIVYTILGYNFIAYINLFKFVNTFFFFINLVRLVSDYFFFINLSKLIFYNLY